MYLHRTANEEIRHRFSLAKATLRMNWFTGTGIAVSSYYKPKGENYGEIWLKGASEGQKGDARAQKRNIEKRPFR